MKFNELTKKNTNNSICAYGIALYAFVWIACMYALGFFLTYLCEGTVNADLQTFHNIWLGGDNEHYETIAQYGYGQTEQLRLMIVFLPMYPVIMKLAEHFIGSYYFSGILINCLSSIGSAVTLYKLTLIDHSKKVSLDTVVFMFLFPFSFFMITSNAEGIFMFLSLLTAYCSRKNKWFLTGLFGFMTALTRNQGFLIFILAAYEYLLWAKKEKRLSAKGLFLLLIPAGYGVYLYINYHVWGDWFKFREFQLNHWHQTFGWFWNNLTAMYFRAKANFLQAYLMYVPQLIIFFSYASLILIFIKNKVRTSYLLYASAFLFMSFSPTFLISGGRYMWAAFPFYIGLSVITKKRKILSVSLKMIFALFLVFFTFAYIRNYGVW